MSDFSNTVCIIDYSTGNVRSIYNALQSLSVNAVISKDPNIINKCNKIILPGVGSFKESSNFIFQNKLDTLIKDFFYSGKYILGICLGMQILFDESSENGYSKGLEILSGSVKKISDSSNLKGPNIGWNKININRNTNISILKNLNRESQYYFVHSYFVEIYNKNIKVEFSNIGDFYFPSIINYKNIFATQFHPEKSSIQGIQLLKNFIKL